MKRKYSDIDISRYLNGDLSRQEKQKFEALMQAEPEFAAQVIIMRSIVAEASSLKPHAAPEHLWARIEAELGAQPQLDSEPISKKWAVTWRAWSRLLDWRPAPVFRIAGVLALLIVGVLIGRFWPSEERDHVVMPDDTNQLQFRLADARAEQYIEKSQILLLGLVNADAQQIGYRDFELEKETARRLVREAGYLRENLSTMRRARVRQLVADLELVLLEIANLEEEHDLENIELIKGGIDSQNLLLKIQLHGVEQRPGGAQNDEKQL